MSPSDTGMGGANPTEGAMALESCPVDIIFPKSILGTPSVISPGSYPTSVELAWNTTTTVTSGGSTSVSTGTTRYIMPTYIPLSPVTIGSIYYYDWNITDPHVTSTHGPLIPSINLPPVTIIDDPNPLNESGVTHSPLGTRVINIPPWPWSTGGSVYPTIIFKQGSPPGPTCTANCGHKCYDFCDGPCLNDCGRESSSSFIDPLDTNPPSVTKCTGPGCVNGKCTGQGLCIERGCTGVDCHNRDHGCIGDDSDDSTDDDDSSDSDDDISIGICFGLDCLSWGCLGLDCSSSSHTCTGHSCRVVTCTGPGCKDGICSGHACHSEDTDCESEEADSCTEYISSTLINPTSTYSTTTVTSQCSTITACSASPTTVTSTITGDSLVEGTISAVDSMVSEDPAMWTSILDDLDSFYPMAFATNYTTESF
ncbi:hypothetical protein BO94DRAFT_591309, partial [Aspergillus sclerotioniger CBS 115572]